MIAMLDSQRDEILCWRIALHGNKQRAHREAYGDLRSTRERALTPRLRRRCLELVKAHLAGELDLLAGPWDHYFPELHGFGQPEHVANFLPLRPIDMAIGVYRWPKNLDPWMLIQKG